MAFILIILLFTVGDSRVVNVSAEKGSDSKQQRANGAFVNFH